MPLFIVLYICVCMYLFMYVHAYVCGGQRSFSDFFPLFYGFKDISLYLDGTDSVRLDD